MKRASILLLSLTFMVAGVLHFIFPAYYVRIVPPPLPAPELLVYLSGVAEFIGGLGLLLPSWRRPAAIWLILVLIAVFPANIYMALRPAEVGAADISTALLWLRLPLQCVLIGWLWWVA